VPTTCCAKFCAGGGADRGELAADIPEGTSVADGRLMTVNVRLERRKIEERVRGGPGVPADRCGFARTTSDSSRPWPKAPNKVSLRGVFLMPSLFQTVLERGGGGDVAAENRAAIVTLAFYVERNRSGHDSCRRRAVATNRRGAP